MPGMAVVQLHADFDHYAVALSTDNQPARPKALEVFADEIPLHAYRPRPTQLHDVPRVERVSAMTPDDIEAAARRVYAMGKTEEYICDCLVDSCDEEYLNFCRRIAAAALNVEEKE
jgi:hypothetical protein